MNCPDPKRKCPSMETHGELKGKCLLRSPYDCPKLMNKEAQEKIDGFLTALESDVEQYGLTPSIRKSARELFIQIVNELGYRKRPKDKLYEQFPLKKNHRIVSPTSEPYEPTDKPLETKFIPTEFTSLSDEVNR